MYILYAPKMVGLLEHRLEWVTVEAGGISTSLIKRGYILQGSYWIVPGTWEEED